MHTDKQKLFRNYEAMDAIYQRRHIDGLTNEPYIVKLEQDRQLLTFFGSRHTNDVQDAQNVAIEKEWRLFIINKNAKKVAFCEGGLRPYEASRDLAIEKYSEPGLLTWLAKRDAILLESPEPDETAELQSLLSQQFNVSEIMTYYFGRQMLQWLRADHKHNRDWQKYIQRFVAFYGGLKPLQHENLDLTKILSMFQATTGQDFDEKNEKLLYDISAPTSNPVSAASGTYRDASLFSAISKAWGDGLDVFALYGSGHAIVLEPAISTLINHNDQIV